MSTCYWIGNGQVGLSETMINEEAINELNGSFFSIFPRFVSALLLIKIDYNPRGDCEINNLLHRSGSEGMNGCRKMLFILLPKCRLVIGLALKLKQWFKKKLIQWLSGST